MSDSTALNAASHSELARNTRVPIRKFLKALLPVDDTKGTSLYRLSQLLGMKNMQRIYRWCRDKAIPVESWQLLVDFSQNQGGDLKFEDMQRFLLKSKPRKPASPKS